MIVRYTLQRLLMLIPVFLSISIVIFLVVHLLPGDPIDNLMRVGSSPEDRAILTREIRPRPHAGRAVSAVDRQHPRAAISARPSCCAAPSPT